MEDFISFLITPLISNPDDFTIETSGGLIFVSLSGLDTGKIIGRKGNVITAIRTLLKAYCANHRLPPTGITIRATTELKTD